MRESKKRESKERRVRRMERREWKGRIRTK